MDLFLAGSQQPVNSSIDIYNLGANRLFSYDYQRLWIDKVIKTKQMIMKNEVTELELYLALSSDAKVVMNELLQDSKNYNLLYSYGNCTNIIEGLFNLGKLPNKLFIDSGAFSMWTKGITVNTDDYINWLNTRTIHLDLFGQVDSIPGNINTVATSSQVKEAANRTWENYLYMRERLEQPEKLLYTFHVGEDTEFLKNALNWTDQNNNHIPYIALGGMVGKPNHVRKAFLDSCFNIIKSSKNPDVKVHAFGMTSFSLLESYPITSADSTTWIMVGAMGNVMSDFGVVSVSEQQKNDPSHFCHLSSNDLRHLEEEVQKYGYDLNELSKNRNARVIHNARYMAEKAKKINNSIFYKVKKLF